MDYWIAVDNRKTGPLKLADVIALCPSPDTLVWHQGLPTWLPAREVPELAAAFGWNSAAPVPPAPPAGTPVAPPVAAPAYTRSRNTSGEIPPPMPRTYLGWSIAAIVLCCMIPAIVSLVYAVKVSSRYSSGDFAGSQKASDRAELWLIISIVCGLVSLPFMILFQILAA